MFEKREKRKSVGRVFLADSPFNRRRMLSTCRGKETSEEAVRHLRNLQGSTQREKSLLNSLVGKRNNIEIDRVWENGTLTGRAVNRWFSLLQNREELAKVFKDVGQRVVRLFFVRV